MIYNFHSHTYRCNHAIGSEEEYIQRAIAGEESELYRYAESNPDSKIKGLFLFKQNAEFGILKRTYF